MKIINPAFEILSPFEREDAERMLKHIEKCARVCYKSEGKTTVDSASAFVSKIAKVFKHESVIEHCSVSVRFVCDRGVSHELVRHRIAAFSQESTRYCNYSGERFGEEITLISPFFFAAVEDLDKRELWLKACSAAEQSYLGLIALGATAQEARSVLPNSLKTEIVMTCNLREWLHVFKLRASSKAHPQMRELMLPLLAEFQRVMPELFADIEPA